MAAMTRLMVCVVFLLGWCAAGLAATRVGIAPIPDEVRTDYFVVTINGRQTPVVHAASSYYLLNFDLDGPATISIRAADAHYWDRGVEVQPMRYGIRPRRSGGVITFRVPGAVKLSITRPGDHFAESDMLFLLGSTPDESGIKARTEGVRYYGPGVHREDIDAHSGDRIYLAPGAVVFGSLNLWQVHDVRVEGRGMIIYDGPQSPAGDEGWMHKRGWHCIVMDQTSNVEIDGITCVVRSPELRVQVCGSFGDAVQPTRLSTALLAGLHRIRIELEPGVENEPDGNLGAGAPLLMWEGPGLLPEAVPVAALVH
jgi:hypothetical protein